MKISYAITVCNEFVEIQKLISFILKNKRNEDEIIILFDKNQKCKEGAKFINKKDLCKIIFCTNLTTPEKRNLGINNANTNKKNTIVPNIATATAALKPTANAFLEP